MQDESRTLENALQKRRQRSGHFAKLSEDENFLLTAGYLLADFTQPLKFPALLFVVRSASQPLGRMIADLFEAQEKGQNDAAFLNTINVFQLSRQLIDLLLVERGLDPGQRAEGAQLRLLHVIPALIRKFLEARRSVAPSVECWGDGTPTREFLYVEDAAEGIALAAEHYSKSDPVNLGSGSEVSIRDLTDRIARLTGFTGSIHWNTAYPNGQPRRALDTSRAAREFDFRARVGLEEGLKKTIDWYRNQCVHD